MSEPRTKRPRIAFFDIETSPMIIAAWQPYEANAVWVERDTHLLSFAVKWEGEKRCKTYALPDYKEYKKDIHDDGPLTRDLHRIMDEADIIIAHNGDAFDIKKANARFAVHGLDPPSPSKSVDTLKIAKKRFKFDSNKLDNLGRYLGVGRKLVHTGADLWRRCYSGDLTAWPLMKRYNAHDVELLERVYLKLRSWDPSPPDIRIYTEEQGCPVCGSQNTIHRGILVYRTKKRFRHSCKDCGHWFSGGLVRAA